MPIDSVGTVSNTGSELQQANIALDDFLQILVAQLSYQDPLKPLDNAEFIAQMAQFTNLQQTQQGNDVLNSLLLAQAATQSIGLIGRNIEVQTDSGNEVGTVTTVSFSTGSPELTIRTTAGEFITGIGLSKVVTVR